MNLKKIDKMITKYIIMIALIVLFALNINRLGDFIGWLWNGLSMVVFGVMLAYVMNIILAKIEKLFDQYIPKLKFNIKRGLSVILTFLIVLIIVYIIVLLIIPEIINASKVIGESLPGYATHIQTFLQNTFKDFPSVVEYIEGIEMNWNDIGTKIVTFLTNGVTNIFYTSINLLSSFTSSIINTLMVIVFSIYLLLDKERFTRVFSRIESIYFKENTKKTINKSLVVIHDSFTSFISGQCIEAIVIGTLCAIGMTALKLPYALMVGTIIGATSLIPVFGAYIGGAVSVFVVFTVSAKSALIFLVYLCVLQQVESNLIYPKVVGTSVGLPSVFVISSVMVFGTLFGIAGMFLGVPVCASVYKLLRMYLEYKEKEVENKNDKK